MSNAVLPVVPKRNATPGVSTVPPASALQLGELAYNAFTGNLYGLKEDGTVQDVAQLKTVNSKAPSGGNVSLNSSDVGAIPLTDKGVANGTATLDSSGKLTSSQIPAALVGAVVFQGVWNASTNSPALTSSVGVKGQYFKVSVAGSTSIDGHGTWYVGDTIIFDGNVWDKIEGQDSEILTVNGKTPSGGNVQLNSADVGAVPLADKGSAGGVATLDGTSHIPSAQIPIATGSQVGGIKAGSGITIDEDGTAHAASQFTLAVATVSVLGGVKASPDITVAADGTLGLGPNVLTSNTLITGGTY